MPKYPNSILATTNIDRHGERWSKEDLMQFAQSCPNGHPMRFEHNMTKPANGIAKNLRVEEIENWYALVGDIFTEEPIDLDKFPALSIAAIGLFHIPDNTEIKCYLPRPFYNDENLIHRLTNIENLAVGKIVRKELDSMVVGLVASAIFLALSPEWSIQYEKKVRPNIIKCLEIIEKIFTQNKITSEFEQIIKIPGKGEVELLFIPSGKSENSGQSIDAIDNGIEVAIETIQYEDSQIKKITLLYYENISAYKVINIIYQNGQEINIIQ